jgi:hypothetical protein
MGCGPAPLAFSPLQEPTPAPETSPEPAEAEVLGPVETEIPEPVAQEPPPVEEAFVSPF